VTFFFFLNVEVADLRLALQRAEQQQAKKEDYLREEISELQQVTRTHYRQLTRIDVYIYLFHFSHHRETTATYYKLKTIAFLLK